MILPPATSGIFYVVVVVVQYIQLCCRLQLKNRQEVKCSDESNCFTSNCLGRAKAFPYA